MTSVGGIGGIIIGFSFSQLTDTDYFGNPSDRQMRHTRGVPDRGAQVRFERGSGQKPPMKSSQPRRLQHQAKLENQKVQL
jgi:hypothetical protein